jgi:methionyl-tRNA formyltransferase
LDGLAAGAIREVPQPADGVTYAQKIDKREAVIQWERSAEEISRQVRAFNPWPMAETRFNGEQLRIWEAEPLEAPSMTAATAGAAARAGDVLSATAEGIDVICGAGVLRIHRLQLAGRKPLPAADFVRGHRLEGARLTVPLASS